jgi:hypothetical protein
VLALFFWATFIADGFVVLSLRVGSHLYPRDQTAMVGGIGSGSWSAVLAVMLPVWGRWFDLKWYGAVFVSASLCPDAGNGAVVLVEPPRSIGAKRAKSRSGARARANTERL